MGNGSDPKNYARLESGYREKALKIYPWICGRCTREFVYSNLRELTVHHIDHDHTNN
ncbi:HNH nuclease family protein, partial [Providencia vermicola]